MLKKVGGMLVLLSGIVGCASAPYEGVPESTPPDQFARIMVPSTTYQERRQNPGGPVISCVDGDFIRSSLGLSSTTTEAKVSTGVRYIGILYERYVYNVGIYRAYTPVWVDAKGGDTYLIRHDTQGSRVRLWLEDQATGEEVGGVPGSEPVQGEPGKRCIAGESVG